MAAGQLGYDLIKELKKDINNEVYAPTSAEMNILDKDRVEEIITTLNPDYIFHCAAYTAVDTAEEECDKCYNINVLGTANIVAAAKQTNAKVIYISTDYVFDGQKEGEYYPEDECKPINVYGYTKYQGEREVINQLHNYLIARISWTFGINGKNFIKTMLRLAENGRKEISVVCDQIGSPSYTVDIVKALVELKEEIGIYHITNEDFCSWYELAKFIFAESGYAIEVHPIISKEYNAKAKRPLNSKLNKGKIKNKLPHWKDGVKRFLKELKGEK